MHRFTKISFRSIFLLAFVLALLFLTWQIGILFGNSSSRSRKKLNRILQLNGRGESENNNEVIEPGGSEDLKIKGRQSSGDGFHKRENKNSKIEQRIQDTPKSTHLRAAAKKAKTKKKIQSNDAVPKPANLSGTTLNNLKGITTTLVTSPSSPTPTPTTLPVPGPINLQYSWSEVYGETGCSPNPWRTILVELFTEWVKMANKHNIEYILFYGSLLGGLRTADVIPYDSDIDLLMDVKYFPKMKEIAVTRGFDTSDGKIRLVVQPEFERNVPSNQRKRYTCKGKLTPNMVDGCSFQEPLGRLVKTYLHIDFYHFYDKGKYLEDPSEEDLKTYDKKDMFPLRPCKFMGLDTFCPNKPWKLLKQYFHSENLESKYKCKNNRWMDKNGRAP